MKPSPLTILDHIVYCCKDLQAGMRLIHDLTGVRPIYGGRHLTKGTHNALIKIGAQSYLEILAPDPENKDVDPLRWMGIDLIEEPVITRWAINSDNISLQAKTLQDYRPDYGSVQEGSRALSDGSTLRWALTDPLGQPAVEVVPFLLDWKDSIHPTVHLNQECTIIDISLYHPDPSKISPILSQLDLDMTIQKGTTESISITLETPKGQVLI